MAVGEGRARVQVEFDPGAVVGDAEALCEVGIKREWFVGAAGEEAFEDEAAQAGRCDALHNAGVEAVECAEFTQR